jgi:hypothetical protein
MPFRNWTGPQRCWKVEVRSSTYVSYLLTAASVNAGRVRERAGISENTRKAWSLDSGNSLEGGNLSSLLSVCILTFTVVIVLAIGIFSAYASVIGILHALANRSQQRTDEKPSLAPGQARAAHAGGD